MVAITLGGRDRTMLERLAEGDADVADLARLVDDDASAVASRLDELADNGLVVEADEDQYRLTGDGERVLAATPAGTQDDRIDTPEAVEQRIESFDLRPDREEAVRNAFSFLRYWGEAFESEIVDAIYPENPAGHDDAGEWWADLVRARLGALPDVDAPADPDAEPWRYGGTPTIAEHTADGRDQLTAETLDEHGGVKETLERLDLSAGEREAVRAAFEFLAARGEASAAAIKDEIYPDHAAGYDSAHEWWVECVRDAFASLPAVDHPEVDRDVWAYRPSTEGSSGGDSEQR